MQLAKVLNKELVDNIKLITIIEKNIAELIQLRDEYSKLWLEYYKMDNLNMVIDKFDRLIAYFNETKLAVAKNDVQSPIIKSDWIYIKHGKEDFASVVDFKKEFNLESKPDSAFLQLMGDTYAKLYINGQYVDEVFARRSLSLLVDYKRMKLIDIAKYLKDSLNRIEIHCENYNAKDKAGVNIYSEIYLKDRTKALLTDETWFGRLPDSDKWQKVTIQNQNKNVIAPNFKTKRTSWVER
jgi:hypothetical protein